MNPHEAETNGPHDDEMAFIRSSDVQPDKFTTPEGAREALDVVGHEVDKVALGAGVGRDFAEALAREKSLSMREDQLEAYATGGSAIDNFKLQAAEDNALLEALFAYAAGEGEPSEEITQLMQGRIDGIRQELQDFDGDFSSDKITAVIGESSPARVHTIESRLKELAKLNTPLELKDMRDRPEDSSEVESPTPAPGSSAEKSSSDGEKLMTESQRFNLPTALQETPGSFNDRKEAALVMKTFQDLGIDASSAADFAKNLTQKEAIFLDSAAKIHGSKPVESQRLWAQNQLWESIRTDPVWTALEPQIIEQGDSLAGKGSTLSREKVMSGFLTFAKQVYPR